LNKTFSLVEFDYKYPSGQTPLMDVLGVGEEGDPWKTPKRR